MRIKLLSYLLFSILLNCFLNSPHILAQHYFQEEEKEILKADAKKFNHYFLAGISIGHREGGGLSHAFSTHYLSSFSWQRYEVGLGLGLENEVYFNLIPAYLHFSYRPFPAINLSLYSEGGLAFNRKKDFEFDRSIPGILLASGIACDIYKAKAVAVHLKLAYRYQETQTVKENPVWNNPDLQNEDIMKHHMHRIVLLLGLKF